MIRLSAGADTLSALGYASQYLRGITNRGSTNGKSSKATVLSAEARFYFKTGINYIINVQRIDLLLSLIQLPLGHLPKSLIIFSPDKL